MTAADIDLLVVDVDVHWCTVCGIPSHEHSPDCYEDDCYDKHVTHWPALCCPGCPCQSYEEAHTVKTLGTTNRRQATRGEADHVPIQHVTTSTRASRTGRGVRAVCGVAVIPRGVPFDPDHPRACRACADGNVEATA